MKPGGALLFAGAGLWFLPSLSQQTATSQAANPPTRHAQGVRTGVFTYRDFQHGHDVGGGTITIRRLADSGNYEFFADISFAEDFGGFRSQRWKAVATPTFEPVSAALDFVRGSEVVPVFDLLYSSGRVSGFVVDRKKSSGDMKRLVDAPVPSNTVDQRIDWAAVLASSLQVGMQFEFNVFDPGTGVSRVTGHVGKLEEVEVPAGRFRAYRILYQIEKTGKTEVYQLLASQDSPRMMLREEFSNGVTSDLIRADPPAVP